MGSSTRPSRGFRVEMGVGHVLWGLAACLAVLHAAVDRAVPEPYMDEVFHVGQAAQYCLGHWGHWDPKISTFPGLYVVPALVARASVAALGLDASEVCSSVRLYRASNAAALLLCAWITYGLLRRLHPAMTRGEAAWKTLALAVLPTHFFYASLFYTDVASLACVLGCYALSLDGRASGSAVAGAVAVLYRQTNVVWVAFIAGAAILERLGGDNAVVEASPGGGGSPLRTATPGPSPSRPSGGATPGSPARRGGPGRSLLLRPQRKPRRWRQGRAHLELSSAPSAVLLALHAGRFLSAVCQAEPVARPGHDAEARRPGHLRRPI